MVLFFASMQDDLHFMEHKVQLLHFASLILILKTENLEMKPSTVPTGQMVLQYKRPHLYERNPTTNIVITAIMKAIMLVMKTSIL
jgi:hypothetical protein